MEFEAIDYEHKRLRAEGSRQWKFWFTETPEGLAFRILTKDTATNCYESVTGIAEELQVDLIVKEGENDEAYFTDMFQYETGTGSLYFFLEADNRELAWVASAGSFAKDGCSFHNDAPLMPEIAG